MLIRYHACVTHTRGVRGGGRRDRGGAGRHGKVGEGASERQENREEKARKIDLKRNMVCL